eukprot:COSAG05_NODE_573_length_8601_cov_58.330981_9_plen_145_part_00
MSNARNLSTFLLRVGSFMAHDADYHWPGKVPVGSPEEEAAALSAAIDGQQAANAAEDVATEDAHVASDGHVSEWVEVLAPGPLTTVQDFGRYGYARHGVSRTGAADPLALHTGNIGNSFLDRSTLSHITCITTFVYASRNLCEL